jgi:N-acylneuraminate cytidylyltransferase
MPGYDYATLLQVTSPMRTAADIDGCIKHCIDAQAESCVSICEAESSPYWMYKLTNKGFIEPLMMSSEDAYQRQKLPRVYQLNGAVYVTSVSFLRREKDFVNSDTLGFVMSDRHSGDIDTLLDFEILAYLHSRR